MCNGSRHTKYPFLNLAYAILLTLAEARLTLCSGFAEVGSPIAYLIAIFGRLRCSILNYFNSSRMGPELIL